MAEVKIPTLTVSGKFDKMGESLKALRDYAVAAAEQAGLSKMVIGRLRLAIDEYSTNIITYGYRDAGMSGTIRATATINDAELVIALVDTAIAFNPLTHIDPDNLDSPLEFREEGGLGIMLTRQNLDDWRYARVGDENRNYFILKRG